MSDTLAHKHDSLAKKDMSLTVFVSVSGSFDGTTVTVASTIYSQGPSNPTSHNVVSSDGTIDLNHMNKSSSHNNKKIHILFDVSGQIEGPNGGINVEFASDLVDAIEVDDNPLPWGGFSAAFGNDATQLLLTDDDEVETVYNYCLKPVINYAGVNYLVSLDPLIINRGGKPPQ